MISNPNKKLFDYFDRRGLFHNKNLSTDNAMLRYLTCVEIIQGLDAVILNKCIFSSDLIGALRGD